MEGVTVRDALGVELLECQLSVAARAKLDELRPELRSERAGTVQRDDFAAMHDRDSVAQALRLVEVVGRQENRRVAARSQAADHVQQLGADAGVEADCRLVEKEHAGARDERSGDLQPPALAAAVAPDGPVDQLSEVEQVEEALRS